MDSFISELLDKASANHRHICPRMVLGVRMGLQGLAILNFPTDVEFSNKGKKLIVYVETDGCGADGISAATDCSIGKRTLRVFDYGKMAATFIDGKSGKAFRIAPQPTLREMALEHSQNYPSRWHAYRENYKYISDEKMFFVSEVELKRPVHDYISHAGIRVHCDQCGEEIINEREIELDGQKLCCPCAGDSYFSYT